MTATVIPFPSRTAAPESTSATHRPGVAVWVRPRVYVATKRAVGLAGSGIAPVASAKVLPEDATPSEAATLIRQALRARSGRAWSVTNSRGTSWGWIKIHVPPARRGDRAAEDAEYAELARLLDLPEHEARGGVSIPASSDFWAEYVARAQGLRPTVLGKTYWD
jgi:hypothetical protein